MRERLPAFEKEVVKLAVPFDKVAVPREVVPLRKVTVPEGDVPVTLAVSVMDCCSSTLVADALRLVVVGVGLVTETDVKPKAEENFVSPL
jgi:hypothetical protein